MTKNQDLKKAFLRKDRLLRGITEDGQLKIAVIKTTNVVREAQRRHNLSLLSTVMLGRALTGVMLLAADLKGEERVILRIEGDGHLGKIVTEANRLGEIRGYVDNPDAKIDVDGGETLKDGVGKGLLSVSKILFNEAEPVTGIIAMVHSDVSNDLSDYLIHSEQVASSLILDVGISSTGEVEEAGGILIQALPGTTYEQVEQIDKNVQEMQGISQLFSEGDYIDTLMHKALAPTPVKELTRNPVDFFCRCSKERFTQALSALSDKELIGLQDESQELVCHYCNEKYIILPEDIKEILKHRVKAVPLN